MDFCNENVEPPATICHILSNFPSFLISITLEEFLLSSQTSGRFDPVQASGKQKLGQKKAKWINLLKKTRLQLEKQGSFF